MADLLEINKLQLLFVAVIPGFVSLKVWGIINASQQVKLTDSFLDAVCYSFLNFAFLFWLIPIANKASLPYSVLLFIAILLVAPAIWPVLVKRLLSSKWLRGRVVNPVPTSWDHFFSRGQPCFLLLHLKDGSLIGGRYCGDSYASSYPEPKDLFISEVWTIDKKGHFLSKIDSTAGMLINYDVIDFIEAFHE
jgi:hypothetical protein